MDCTESDLVITSGSKNEVVSREQVLGYNFPSKEKIKVWKNKH